MKQIYVVYETDAWHSTSHRDCAGVFTSKWAAVNAIVKNHRIELDEFFSEEEIENICRILKPYADTLSYELLGFHTLGFPKYDSLGMVNELKDAEQLSTEKLKTLKNILSKHQL
jgi:hypothetical protein